MRPHEQRKYKIGALSRRWIRDFSPFFWQSGQHKPSSCRMFTRKSVTVHGTLKLEKRASFKPDLRFVDAAFRLVPILQRRNLYGMHSHAGAWERGAKLVRHLFKRQVSKKSGLKCHSFRGLNKNHDLSFRRDLAHPGRW